MVRLVAQAKTPLTRKLIPFASDLSPWEWCGCPGIFGASSFSARYSIVEGSNVHLSQWERSPRDAARIERRVRGWRTKR